MTAPDVGTQAYNARLEQQRRVVWRRVLTKGGVRVAIPVTLAATTQAVVFTLVEPDSKFSAQATPNWGTMVWVTAKSQTGLTLNFSVAAPAGATVDLVINRSE
jgi:hypothetical protein